MAGAGCKFIVHFLMSFSTTRSVMNNTVRTANVSAGRSVEGQFVSSPTDIGPLQSRILVVDDEECIRAVFEQLLQREGYEVATAEDGLRG